MIPPSSLKTPHHYPTPWGRDHIPASFFCLGRSDRPNRVFAMALLEQPHNAIRTARLVLRPLREGDDARIFALFAMSLDLQPGEDSSAVTARAEDAQMIRHPLTVEVIGKVPGFNWLTEVIVILPADLPAGQDVLVSVTYRTQTSNKVRIKIK